LVSKFDVIDHTSFSGVLVVTRESTPSGTFQLKYRKTSVYVFARKKQEIQKLMFCPLETRKSVLLNNLYAVTKCGHTFGVENLAIRSYIFNTSFSL